MASRKRAKVNTSSSAAAASVRKMVSTKPRQVIQFTDGSEENDADEDDDFIDSTKPKQPINASVANSKFRSLARKTTTPSTAKRKSTDGSGIKTKKTTSPKKKGASKTQAKARVTRTATSDSTIVEVTTTAKIQPDIRSFFVVDEQHEANIERKKRKERERQMWPEPGDLPKTIARTCCTFFQSLLPLIHCLLSSNYG